MGYTYKAIIAGREYLTSEIHSCTCENSLMNKQLEVGNVAAGRLDITITPKTDDIPEMSKVEFFMRDTGSTNWITRGTYYVHNWTLDRESNRITLECYDAILSLDVPFIPEYPYPITMQGAIATICSSIGILISLDTNIKPYTLSYKDSRTKREVLQDIASAHAGNFTLTMDGYLRLVPIYEQSKEHDIARSATTYGKNKEQLVIQAVSMRRDDGTVYSAGTVTNGSRLYIHNANATQEMTNDIYAKVNGYVHNPFSATKTYFPDVSKIVITGAATVQASEETVTEQYTATVYNRADVVMPSERVIWSLSGVYEGITISQDGLLSVTSDASSGKIQIVTTSTTNRDVSASFEVEIKGLVIFSDFNITIISGSDRTFILPTSGRLNNTNNSYNWIVDWGDGTIEEHSGTGTTTSGISHTYLYANRLYSIKFAPRYKNEQGWLRAFGFNSQTEGSNTAANKQKVVAVGGQLTEQMIRTNESDNYVCAYWFYDCAKLSIQDTFQLPQNLTSVGDYFFGLTFRGCTNFSSIGLALQLPQNLTSVGNSFCISSFNGCTYLRTGVKQFFGNLALAQAQLNKSNVYLYTFNNCSNLSETLSDIPQLQMIPPTRRYTFQGAPAALIAPLHANWK